VETAPSPIGTIEQQESLDNDLAQLTTPQRKALELAFFGGCSQAEIASAMQTPVGNVKNHLRRGLAKLRQIVARP
jgi:RNA polymerase sigma-70 factor (ECF subfamily)